MGRWWGLMHINVVQSVNIINVGRSITSSSISGGVERAECKWDVMDGIEVVIVEVMVGICIEGG
jgi:hypothetical protein